MRKLYFRYGFWIVVVFCNLIGVFASNEYMTLRIGSFLAAVFSANEADKYRAEIHVRKSIYEATGRK